MAMQTRLDKTAPAKFKRLSNGMIRAEAAIAKVGVQKYITKDGDVTFEYRSEEEVFKKETMDSFEQVPVTDDHPTEPVTADNYKTYAVGSVSHLLREDDLVVASVMVADKGAIESVMAGKKEISCGYVCDVVPQEGFWKGVKYTHVQKNIQGNHIAIVNKGRAGDRVRLRIDTAESDMDNEVPEPAVKQNTKVVNMEKIKIDGQELEVSAEVKKAVESVIQQLQDAKRDSSDEAISARVSRRVGIQSKASKIISADVTMDALSDIEIMKRVIAKANPSLKLEGKSADAIEGMFEMVQIPVAQKLDVAPAIEINVMAEAVKQAGVSEVKKEVAKSISSMMANHYKGVN
jgi:uncharacterized protein